MVQRIQSIYLLLTTGFSVLFLSGDIIKFTDSSGNLMAIKYNGLVRYFMESAPEHPGIIFPLTALFLLIAVISLVVIFLFKNRKLQIRLTTYLLLLAILLTVAVAAVSFYVMSRYNADIVLTIKIILPLLIAICLYLAYRGIKRDEDLVKSYDRLR
jgi:heme A synthase